MPPPLYQIIALPDEKVEEICEAISKEGEVVVAANYNCPGQIVISGSIEGINLSLIHILEAIIFYEQYKPDLILMDIKMPNINGLDATKAIREMSASVPLE